MELTSKKLEVLVAVLAVLCFAATVWVWPRLSRAHWRPLLGRIGLLTAGQLFTLSAILLAANNWGGFYSSWGDLFGTDQGSGTISAPGTQASSTVPGNARSSIEAQGGPKPVALEIPGVTADGGTVQKVLVHGGSTGLTENAYVYLPAAYQQPAYAHADFPVIVVFTGYPGTAENLITRMKYPTVVAQAIQQRQLQPTILVMMRPSVAMPRDTECQDVLGGPQAQSFFSKDLREAVASRYRVDTEARGWGVIGDSTGGYCALSLALRAPQAFTAAVSLSGYYDAAHDSTTGDLFGGSPTLRQQADLLWRLRNLPGAPVSLLVTSSRTEHDWKATLRFAASVKRPTQISTLYLPSGGHNFATWNRETPQALRWLGTHLTTPDPGTS